MTLKYYLNSIFLLTILCWIIFLLSLFLINPEKAGFWGFVLFYFSLFLSLTGTGSILGFIIKTRLSKRKELIFKHVLDAFVWSLIISAILVFLLILKGLNLLYWWNFLIFILFLISLFLVFRLIKK